MGSLVEENEPNEVNTDSIWTLSYAAVRIDNLVWMMCGGFALFSCHRPKPTRVVEARTVGSCPRYRYCSPPMDLLTHADYTTGNEP